MAKAQTQTGTRAIRAIWEKTRLEAMPAVDDPSPMQARDGVRPGQWDGAPYHALPPACPVHVVGMDGEGGLWCVTATGDLRMIEKWDQRAIADLFAPHTYFPFWAWPGWGEKKSKDPETGEVSKVLAIPRIQVNDLFTCLVHAAKKKPLFDPAKQHRGRGGWTDKAGAFLWHSGTALWRSDGGRLQRAKPTEHDGFLYTRQPATIEPWQEAVRQDESPARRILAQLRTWNWERPYLDPVLVLGWIVTAIMGGALKARPIVFTTGGAGVGKSMLHELVRNVLENVVFSAVDTTAAGIYQRMKHDALPIMVDELEAKPGSAKATAVIELARVAYTGGDIARGGQDHDGTTFRMHSSFFFSAILPPVMQPQDRTRMAILNLAKLDASQTATRPDFTISDVDGQMLLRQVIDGFADFSTRILPDWWGILHKQSLDSRAIDTYGTLLAAAEMVLGQEPLEEIGLPVTEAARLGEIIGEATRPDRSEISEVWHECLARLLGSSIDAWKDGARPSVGGVMAQLAAVPSEIDLKYARERLELVNLTALDKGGLGDPGAGPYLAIPTLKNGPSLAKLFMGTKFEDGNWWNALKQAPAHIVVRGQKSTMRINGQPATVQLVDMAAYVAHAERSAG